MNTPEVTTPVYLRRVNAALTLNEIPDYPAALEQLEKAKVEKPDSVDVHVAFGIVYESMANRSLAESAFRRALGLDPDNELVRAMLAGLLMERRSWDEALNLLHPLIERKSLHSLVWRSYLHILFRTDGEEKLLTQIKSVTQGLEEQQLGDILSEIRPALRGSYPLPQKSPETLLDHVDELLEKYPNNVGLLEIRQRALRALGRYDGALETLNELEALGETRLGWDFFEVYHALGQHEKALAYVSRTGADWSDLAYRIHDIAITLDKSGRTAEAATVLAQFMEKRPRTGLWIVYFVPILLKAERYNEAEELLDRLEAEGLDEHIGPGEFGATISRGYIYLARGEVDRAIEYFESREDVYWSDEEVFPPIPVVLEGKLLEPFFGSEDFADQAYGEDVALSSLAVAYLMTNNLDRAYTVAREAVALDDEAEYPERNISGYVVLGSVEHARGDVKAARTAWEHALKRANESGEEELAEQLSELLFSIENQFTDE